MATGTYKITNNPVATYGENSAATGALQRAINASGGISTPIAVDNRYGDQTKAAYDSLIKSGYTYSNGSFIKPVPTNVTTNPIISGTQTANENNAITLDVTNLKKTYDDNSKFLQDRIDALEEQRKQDIAQIRADFEAAAAAQAERQKKDYAGRSTSLITSGGGFLGATQSQSGVLQNLQATFEQEKAALMAKRDAAIREAENAINEKQFALAKEKASEARSYEQEVYNRQKDFADQKLALAREARAQQEFDMGVADKKIAAYATMDDATFNAIDPKQIAEIDKAYYPGYTAAAREVAKKVAEGKTIENDIDLKNKLQTLINKTPAGQKIVLPDGSTYMGMKKSGTGPVKGLISTAIATQLGIPSLAGKDEGDIILSLSLDNPPQWYKEFYQVSAPDAYAQIKDNPSALATDWKIFTSQPDIVAYKNSAVVTNRITKASSNPLLNISAEDIAGALNE
jgi:hypothetical protein